jgi:hypothetical protein
MQAAMKRNSMAAFRFTTRARMLRGTYLVVVQDIGECGKHGRDVRQPFLCFGTPVGSPSPVNKWQTHSTE